MRFASVLHQGRPLAVVIDGDQAIPLLGHAELGASTPAEVLQAPPLDHAGAIAVKEVTFRPVVPAPGKVICVGLNYVDHVEETQRDLPSYPVLFTKFATSLTGPYDPIPCPPESDSVDYEGELTVVIGKPARRVPEADALAVVAGYTVANDTSMRDYQYKTHQWLQGKAWDRSTPVGPVLVTPDEAGDPAALTLRTTVNGQLVQEATTDLMIFPVARLIAAISEFATLEPGDLILTGTPAGVGFRREPPLLLGDGDVVTVEIGGIGRIENRFVAGSGQRRSARVGRRDAAVDVQDVAGALARARVEAKCRTASAMSSGRMLTPSVVRCGSAPRARPARCRRRRRAPSRQLESQIREPWRTASGLTVLTRIPGRPPSSARQRARCSSAAFADEYAAALRPRRARSSTRRTRSSRPALRAQHAERRARDQEVAGPEHAWLRCHSASDVSSIAALDATPAFETTMSTPPKRVDGGAERRGHGVLGGHVARDRGPRRRGPPPRRPRRRRRGRRRRRTRPRRRASRRRRARCRRPRR